MQQVFKFILVLCFVLNEPVFSADSLEHSTEGRGAKRKRSAESVPLSCFRPVKMQRTLDSESDQEEDDSSSPSLSSSSSSPRPSTPQEYRDYIEALISKGSVLEAYDLAIVFLEDPAQQSAQDYRNAALSAYLSKNYPEAVEHYKVLSSKFPEETTAEDRINACASALISVKNGLASESE